MKKISFNKFKTPFLYSSGSLISALSQLLVSFVIARYIAPEDLGIWASLNIITSYCILFQGGIINGLNLELPIALGKGNVTRGNKLASLSNTFVLFSNVIILLIGLGFFFIYNFKNEKYQYGFLAVIIISLLTFYQNFLASTYRSKNSFEKLGYIQMFVGLINIVTIIFIIKFLFYGLIVKSIFTLFVSVLLQYYYRPIKTHFYWNWKLFKSLVKVGFPIFVLVYINSVTSTFDKLLLIKYSTSFELGLYSFAFYAYSSVLLFSSAIATYIYPRMTYNFSKNNDSIALWRYVKKVYIYMIAFQIPIGLIGLLVIPYFLNRFFPVYKESLIAIQILFVAGLIKGCSIGINVLWSMKKWKYMYLSQFVYSFFFLVMPSFLFFYMENKIIAVSLGVLLSNIIYLIFSVFLTFRATNRLSN